MPQKKHTTVVLSESGQQIKEDLAPVFGLKNILSAGLILFSRLSDAQQKHMIAEANGYQIKDPAELAAHEARLCMKRYQSLSQKDFAVSLQFLSDEESHAIQQLLTALNPAIKHAESIEKTTKTRKEKSA